MKLSLNYSENTVVSDQLPVASCVGRESQIGVSQSEAHHAFWDAPTPIFMVRGGDPRVMAIIKRLRFLNVGWATPTIS
ncbi:hypothetical protein Desac_2124 [Desulfobacca acetoxidans DSM 11109]|uniref:Uncharacterized protein n=1 Tax=Desulfobacca acetoxidans (strain ATCC 700848 / DSM 11109 / ASRB2) TaxID=880072 RepID=F2NK09_DESAR|nr:hypothetical protein Desac_2124 [Desulfobacca acetoxidans DSM 11109]